MKVLVISDIHGSSYYAKKIKEINKKGCTISKIITIYTRKRTLTKPDRIDEVQQVRKELVDKFTFSGLYKDNQKLTFNESINLLKGDTLPVSSFIKNKEGHPAMFKATADSEFLCACFDFTNPEFLAWYEERVKKIVRMGVSVIKTDFSEAVPEDVVFYNGMSGREGHNLLTYLYAKNIYTWMKEICDERGELPMLWGRSGYVGSHTIPAAWAGDSSSDKASHSAILQAGLGMAMSGVSFWGYDLGGFYNTGYIGNEERPNVEDYLSSVQMGLWMPLSRAHGKTPREPWQYGDMALKEVKKWINFRHRLVPYLYHTACQSHQSGIPMIRPLVMEYPKDPIAKTQNLSYMLGDALLISPGFDRDEYELYLPEGRWQDIESKEVYEGMTFVHIENKAFADGGTSLRVFQKEGTSIPLFAQKEVLHVPAQLWKQEDLEFMTFQKKDVD